MIRAVIRHGAIHALDRLPADWAEGQELVVEPAEERQSASDDGWLEELNAAAAKIPDRVHEELAAALELQEAESKELGRREMERSP